MVKKKKDTTLYYLDSADINKMNKLNKFQTESNQYDIKGSYKSSEEIKSEYKKLFLIFEKQKIAKVL